MDRNYVISDIKDFVISEIKDFYDQCLCTPWIKWSRDDFKRRSYYRSATKEIIERIKKEQIDPLTIIENYSCEMDTYYEKVEDEERRFMFSSLRDCADDILFLF